MGTTMGMASPAKPLVVALAVLAAVAPSTAGAAGPSDVAFVDRITWGATPAAVAELRREGEARFLERQLHPGPGVALPPEVLARLQDFTAAKTSMVDMAMSFEQTRKAVQAMTDPDKKKAANDAYYQELARLGREAQMISLMRDIYSPDQLREQMTWFWMNHFSVLQNKRDIRTMIADYEETAIRGHALGKFRDLLGAVVHHPAMLRYLDNDQNAANHINENYARELMELHTMGVGSGYTQKDVEELARVLTGLGVNVTPDQPRMRPGYVGDYVRKGLFEFNPERHDYGDKLLLGHRIRGRGLKEADEALDILCREPATARYVSRKLAIYFVSDDPPPELVERMAATFQRTDGDIAEVLKTLFASAEFKASLGKKFKDPVHYAVSAVRLAYGETPILNAQPINGWLYRMSEALYERPTPDGYPMTAPAWSGSGQMTVRFEIARAIGSGNAGLFKTEGPEPVDAPAYPELATALWSEGLDRGLRPATRRALDQASTPREWNTLFLASPEFMHR
jgi:uncharacterized protein (DUF1800 family)